MKQALRIALPILGLLLGAGALQQHGAGSTTAALILGIGAMWSFSAGTAAVRYSIGIAVAAALAMAVSVYLGMQHDAAAGASFCNVNATFDCDSVNRSAYSELFGVPIAYLGAALYAGLLAVGVGSTVKPAAMPKAPYVVLAAGAASVVTSVVLAGISAFALGTWCLLCISLYGLNLIIAAVGHLWARDGGEGEAGEGWAGIKHAFGSGLASNTVFIVFVVVLAATRLGGGGAGTAASGSDTKVEDLYQAVPQPLVLDGSDALWGNPSAPYQVVEYADFQCPYCAAIAEGVHDLASDGDIAVTFRHYPISSICNPNVPDPRHENSCAAAASAECARQQGKAWDLSRLMFKNQTLLEAENIQFMAKQAGLDLEIFRECLSEEQTMAAITDDIESAKEAGLEGTPTLFLKGTHGDTWVRVQGGPEEVQALVDAHRQGAVLPPPPTN